MYINLQIVLYRTVYVLRDLTGANETKLTTAFVLLFEVVYK